MPDLFSAAMMMSLTQAGGAVIAGLLIYRLAAGALWRAAEHGVLDSQLRYVIALALKVLLSIAVILLCLGAFGISIEAFWAALSAVLVLVAVGFVAVWSVLSNVLCSVLLITLAPFRIGDEIELQDPGSPVTIRGRVVGVNLMFTSLRSPIEGEAEAVLTRVPNNLFFQKYIRRWPGTDTTSLKTYVADKHHERVHAAGQGH